MERLTYDFAVNGQHCWQVKGADNATCEEVCKSQEVNGCIDCPIAKALERLSAYEDTGLTPEEIKAKLDGLDDCQKLDAQGCLLVLPCKAGDRVYQTDGIRIYESTVRQLIFDTENIAFDVYAIGKTVFLTREEAEKAMRKGEKDDE